MSSRGGRFREVYYWDSFFTMLGLVRSGRTDLVRSMLDDFAYLVETFGHIPNGQFVPTTLSRSQPPFLAAMVGLYAGATDTAHALPTSERWRPSTRSGWTAPCAWRQTGVSPGRTAARRLRAQPVLG